MVDVLYIIEKFRWLFISCEDIYLIDAEGCLSNETVLDIATNMLKQMYISKLMQMELQIALNNLLYLRGSVLGEWENIL